MSNRSAPPPAAEIRAILDGARALKDGSWKLTLEVPKSDASKIAALSLYTGEASFMVKFYVLDDPAGPSPKHTL